MPPLIFAPAAREDLFQAQDWYERESSGLGVRFRAAVESAVERIAANPFQFPCIHRNVRRALLRHFPYTLLFVASPGESILVIACFHASRNPLRWKRRI